MTVARRWAKINSLSLVKASFLDSRTQLLSACGNFFAIVVDNATTSVLQSCHRQKGATMRAFLIDSKTDECKAIDIEPKLSEYYRLIGCDCIDITVRRIGGEAYNIVVDDEGLLKPNRASGVCMTDGIDEILAGSLLVFGIDPENYDCGNKSLEDWEVAMIESRIGNFEFSDGSTHPVLMYTV